ncbi:hypothetical protein MQE36_05795 [Zhouia spongiae]|uniref:Uncharacterized protein n=1 Tax=Zhouia spongiae TaxID=2202721 RepID=A0ABY3YT28_9FLAO|nr:hypothetical protein [Zhouia spongiae]UNY99858.1 hypothetical protein MQE36_05795 [Zhouia spongiae]
MGATKSLKVKEDYSLYNRLLEERKSIFTEVIEVNKVGNNANTLSQAEDVEQEVITEQVILIVDVKLNNYNFFQFKLRCKDYIPNPFFRFDSDGETHRNRIEGIPFEEQAVTPPHFHKFNENGIEIAYKTDKLLDEKESKALEEINLCIIHFFHESNTRLKQDDFPEVKISSNSLGLSFTSDDPNENIDYV